MKPPAISPRAASLTAWALCCLMAAALFIAYMGASRAAGGGRLVMPLDDVYIHFRYAEQIAAGHPYRYNDDQPPSSGATSFLYPYLLAVGAGAGFHGLELGVWALGIGAVAWALALWAIFTLTRALAALLGGRRGLAWLMLLVFGLNGVMQWHFMSGMETGLAVLFTLWTVRGLVRAAAGEGRHPDREALAAAALLALTRPEGAVLAVLTPLVLVALRFQAGQGRTRARLRAAFSPLLLLPLAAVAVQPLVNLALTGSFTASGSAAKSLLGLIPSDGGVIAARIADNFTRMWREYSIINPEQIYSGIFIVFALVGIGVLCWHRRSLPLALALLVALLVLTLLVSTLDTAFWHFRRYQMPILALLFVLAAAGVVTLSRLPRYAATVFVVLFLGAELIADARTMPEYFYSYRVNTAAVAAQPLAMADWLAANAPAGARIAVHDVGMTRDLGGHETLDMVGLTTPGAAESWRNGPGAVGEWLQQQQPDLIASYGEGHGYGLGMLAQTDLYAETLATFTVTLDPARNVALAAETQGVYRPHWETSRASEDTPSVVRVYGMDDGSPSQPTVTPTLTSRVTLMSRVDVADVDSEHAAHYRWSWLPGVPMVGFASEFHQFATPGCLPAPGTSGDRCTAADGGRRIAIAELFSVAAEPGHDLLLVTRVHPETPGTFDVYANDHYIGTRVIPAIPGTWLEIPTLIPAQWVTDSSVWIHIVPRMAFGDYQPYHHWAFALDAVTALPEREPTATWQQGSIRLYDPIIAPEPGLLRLTVTWGTPGSAQGDAKLFVHLLNPDGTIAAQTDVRPGANGLPPGNWLPGAFTETLTVDTAGLSGEYPLMLGLYDPVTNQRLMPAGAAGRIDTDAIRVNLGIVELR